MNQSPCVLFRSALPPEFRQVLQVMLYHSFKIILLCDLKLTRSPETRMNSLPSWIAREMEQSYLPPGTRKDQMIELLLTELCFGT